MSSKKQLTAAELLLLGLLAEMPRHGYELEQVIEQRGMREWTQIGFSSIYFVLGKLEKLKLVVSEKPAGLKAKKTYRATPEGYGALTQQSLAALSDVRPTYHSVLLGMAHWPMLEKNAALQALETRGYTIAIELKRVENIQFEQQPLPDFVEALFDHALGQLSAEGDWVKRTLDYMKAKPNE